MMGRLRLLSITLLLISLTGCARHHVVPRDQGRVDGAKSIASSSELDWKVRSEPAEDTRPGS